ncbi:DUF58 domain-containing protein [Akkermansiaceae bacterium]|jgi:uncharacterized protein (DUF58 family)|nr:DUF58 domain-containing protein [Verrucomicrobiota bacterium]MDA7507505.1 DUF58 domain-containing protein [Akkermansiaceae bacterium]MDA7516341.1 DUF58 domain-containing protein [bacterium]MBT6165945.1 DUF58 domain-containing protein [Verrucomicrobiota bacterium]MBT7214460.1 DUF58 domain-containing protein [Verrucomicrobiota bacterium]
MEAGPNQQIVQTPPVTVTPRGILFLLVALTLTMVGVFRIDGDLIALGTAGLLLGLMVIVFGKWNLRGIHLKLSAPSRVFADTSFDLRLTQLNKRNLFDACSTNLELNLSHVSKIETHATWTAARSSSTSKLRGSIAKRGAISDHPCTLSSAFPLGIFRFSKKITLEHEILVFPKPLVPKEFFANGAFDEAWDGGGFQSGDTPGEPRGLRPYQPGDRAKQIHWPATIRSQARGRSPRVREYDPPGLRPHHAVVIFHSFGTDHTLIRTDLFERSLSLACGTLRHLRGIGLPANLRADFLAWKSQKTFHSEAWSDTLTLLAQAKRSNHTEAHDVLSEIEATPAEDAIIIISDMPLTSWKHILPERRVLIIDIQQHRFEQRGLNFKSREPRRLKDLAKENSRATHPQQPDGLNPQR